MANKSLVEKAIPDGHAFAYFIASALIAAVVGGIVFQFLSQKDPITRFT